MNFTEWINGKIKESGLKKKFIAEKLGVGYDTFLAYNKKQRMPLVVVVDLCILLNVNLEELKTLELHGNDNQKM